VEKFKYSQSRLEPSSTRCLLQRLAGLEEAGLGNGVVLGVEFKGDGIANGRRDVGRAVHEVAVRSDYDSVVYGNRSRCWGCRTMSKSRKNIDRRVWTYEVFRGSSNKSSCKRYCSGKRSQSPTSTAEQGAW
jgi:hypothetical protein